MTKLTIQFLTLAVGITFLAVTSVFAQKFVTLKNGKATVRATIGAGESVRWAISGKKFEKLTIRQRGREKFRYEIRRGSEILSSGHTTGVIRLESDGDSTYSITVFNDESKARRIVLGWMETGGGNPKV